MDSELLETTVVPASAAHKRNCQASVIGVSDGDLLLAYSDYLQGSMADHAPANIIALRSEDGGCSWGSPYIVADSPEVGDNVQSVSLLRLGNGRIAIFYILVKTRMGPNWIDSGFKDTGGTRSINLMMHVSSDDGRSWSDARCINPADEPYQCMLNDAAVRLSSGRIIIPCDQTTSNYDAGCIAFLRPLFSDDDGETWRQSRYRILLTEARSMGEPSLTELSCGRLIMITRSSRAGFVYKCYSDDGGDTWSLPEATSLVTSTSPGQVRRIPGTDDILVVWNQVTRKEWTYGFGRHRLSCAVSSDGGDTWQHHRNLESLDDRAYVPPEEAGIRLVSGQIAGVTGDATAEHPPAEIGDRKAAIGFRPAWHSMAEYPSAGFVGDTALITYDITTRAGSALKLRRPPKQWFYGSD